MLLCNTEDTVHIKNAESNQQDTNIRVQTSDGDNINYISGCFISEYLSAATCWGKFYNSVLVV